MDTNLDPLNKQAQAKVDYSYFIKMALEKKITWNMLAFFLNDLTPTLEKSKQVIEILLKELQMLQSKLEEIEIDDKEIIEVLPEESVANNVSIEADSVYDQTKLNHNKSNIRSEMNSFDGDQSGKDGIESDHDSSVEYTNEPKDLIEMNVNEIKFNIEGNVDSNIISVENPTTAVNDNEETEVASVYEKLALFSDEEINLEEKAKNMNCNDEDSVEKVSKNETIDQNDEPKPMETEIVESGKKISECKICGIIVKHLKVHMNVHSDKKPKCKVCNKTFSRPDNLKAHEKVHIVEKSFKCKSCSDCFRTILDLKKHERIHDDVNSFKCEPCGKVFSIVSDLKKHQVKHSEERPFHCKTCDASFKSKHSLNIHYKIHKNIKIRYHKCIVCSKQFTNIDELKNHKLSHGEKPFQCNDCEKSYSMQCKLREHKISHTGEKLYKCKTCNMTFGLRKYLSRHEKSHSQAKQFHCTTCDKSFRIKTSLTVHERIHNGERPYVCKTCNKSFTQMSALKNHERIHTGEIPFQCNYCSKRFSQKCSLISHERRAHTGEKPYECKTCGRRFVQSSDLKAHMKTHIKN